MTIKKYITDLNKSKGPWKKGKKSKERSFYDKRQDAWKNKELTVSNMYDSTSEHPEVAKKIIDSLKWVTRTGPDVQDDSDLDNMFIAHTYSGVQHFGITDYKDHSRDSAEQLKQRILKNIQDDRQLGHYYDYAGTPVNTIVVSGHLGGVDGYFVYPEGRNAFGHPVK